MTGVRNLPNVIGRDHASRHSVRKRYHAAFSAAVTRARVTAVGNLIARGLAGGSGSGMAQFVLERRFRKEHGPQLLVRDAREADPIRLEGDLKIAAAVRADKTALRQIHDAVAAAVAAAAQPRKKLGP